MSSKKESYTKLELSRGEIDWIPLRECYVRAFYRYPLYEYLVPNENKREEFLRSYLEAVYDVTVRNGSSCVICVNLYTRQHGDIAESRAKTTKQTIGGVIFVPPSRDGVVFQHANEDNFCEAYKRYNLGDIDSESLARVIHYGNWEMQNIYKKLIPVEIPLWDGIICAIDPTFAGKGCGSMNYTNCIRIITEFEKVNKRGREKKVMKAIPYHSAFQEKGAEKCRLHEIEHNSKYISESGAWLKSWGMNKRQGLSLSTKKKRVGKEQEELNSNNHRTGQSKKLNYPMVVALSHCEKAVNFHKKNGFHSVAEVDFVDEAGNSPFSVSLLLMDPFKTGKIEHVAKGFGRHSDSAIEKSNEMKVMEPIQPPSDCRISSKQHA